MSGDSIRAPRVRTAIGARLKEYQRAEVERILSACTRCGKCFEVCPMRQYSEASETDKGGTVVQGVLTLLLGEKTSAEALSWIAVCARSGTCVPACPENVDPQMMLRLAHMTALGGRDEPKQLEPHIDPDYFNRVRAFAQLQFSEPELKDWM